MKVHEATQTADSDWLAYIVKHYGARQQKALSYTLTEEKQADVAGEYAFTFIQKVTWCCAFMSDRARSFRHSPAQPGWRTAAPPSRRRGPSVCGSRLSRAWRSSCIAPGLCPNPSEPEHLLDGNRHIREHNGNQCRHIECCKQRPHFPPLARSR